MERIHLFGFAQGGTVASEFALKLWRSELSKSKDNGAGDPRTLGSVVTVCGPLLSFSTTTQRASPTPILVAYRPAPAETALPANALVAFRRGFSTVSDTNMGRGEGMPRSKAEWEPIMRFWSERLSRRPMEGLYEVLSGSTQG